MSLKAELKRYEQIQGHWEKVERGGEGNGWEALKFKKGR